MTAKTVPSLLQHFGATTLSCSSARCRVGGEERDEQAWKEHQIRLSSGWMSVERQRAFTPRPFLAAN